MLNFQSPLVPCAAPYHLGSRHSPWAEILSPCGAMSKSRPFSLWVQLAAAPLGKWAAAILEETVNVLMEGRRLSLA